MSGQIKACIRLLVPAAKAAPSPAIGQALGSLGVNMMAFCREFNGRTQQYRDNIPMRVLLTAKKDNSFEFTIRIPPTTWFIKQASQVEKGADKPGLEPDVGMLHVKQIYEIAKIKLAAEEHEVKSTSLLGMCRMIVSTARSMGITVDTRRETELKREHDELMAEIAAKKKEAEEEEANKKGKKKKPKK